MSRATYAVKVDWNNDADYGDTGEVVTARVRNQPGLTIVRGKDHARALAPPMAGAMDCELDNQSKDYSPENGASPLTGRLLPGRKAMVQATFGVTTYDLFRGFLDDLPQHPERNRKSVGLPCLGSLSRLAGKTVSTPLYQTIRTDEALGYILDAAGWPIGDRVLDTGKTTLSWWWLDNEDAFSAAKALLNSEGPGAALYEDGQGRIVFESRHYRLLTARSTSSQATLSQVSEPFRYNPGLKDIINVAEIEVKVRTAKVLGVVWSLGQTVTLAPGEARQYAATASDPFTVAVTPVLNTDYTVSAGSLASVALSRTSGASAVVTLTAGASGATVTGLQLRAQAVSVDNTVLLANTVDASASIAKYGRQPYTYSIRAEVDANVAQDLANAIVALYQGPRPIVTVRLNNGTDARLTQILSREISDRVTITEAQTVLSADFFIDRIEHAIGASGLSHVAEFACEKVDPTGSYAIWGVSQWGVGRWGF